MKKFFSNEINSFLSYTASLLLHVLIFLIAYFFTNLHISKVNLNAEYVQVFTSRLDNKSLSLDKSIQPQTPEKELEKNISNNVSPSKKIENQLITELVSYLDEKVDTTSLQQVYSETSLNVTIKYPTGWTFVDQNVDEKLDGVTFWTNSINIIPPPYVHLEVCDKDLFLSNKFKYNFKIRDAIMFFNDPESLANYYSQTFYFRTETSKDFSLKLSIKGKEAFESFRPIFYGMLKSFRFGKQLF